MINKNEIKKIRSLHTKKGRTTNQLLLIEGKRIIDQILQAYFPIIKVWATTDFKDNNSHCIQLIKTKKISFDMISNQNLKKITATKNPSGIIGIAPIPKGDIKKMDSRIIVLDNISDPGNLGTIIRTANWFGVQNILLSKECVDPYNSKVIRSGMGAHFKMNIIIDNIEVIRKGDVKRSKLYYLRDRTGRRARISSRDRGDELDQYE